MHIWFGFSIARDKETLLREEKRSNIITIETKNDFVSWLGQALTACYDLYNRVSDGIDDIQEEDMTQKILRHPLWGDLRNFARNQIAEAKQLEILYNKIEIECGTDYHELIDMINKAGVEMYGGVIKFVKSEESGCGKKAKVGIVNQC